MSIASVSSKLGIFFLLLFLREYDLLEKERFDAARMEDGPNGKFYGERSRREVFFFFLFRSRGVPGIPVAGRRPHH